VETESGEDNMELNAALDQALAAAGAVVSGVAPNQLAASTPCAGFDVKKLLDHMVDVNRMFDSGAREKKADVTKFTGAGDDPATSFDQTAKLASEAWKEKGILEAQIELPFGTFPGAVAINFFISETVVHGWDLARATGQTITLDPGVVETAWDAVKDMPDAFRGPEGSGAPFGMKVDVPQSASALDRLIGHMGRQP